MSLLRVQNLTMRFGGLTAVNQVSFDVRQGEIFSVIGPNGAGKTTVFNAITGVYAPTEGNITLEEKQLEKKLTCVDMSFFLLIGLITGVGAVLLINAQTLWEQVITGNYIYQQAFPWGSAITKFFQQLLDIEVSYTILPLLVATAIGSFGAWQIWAQFKRTPEYITKVGICRTFQNIRLFKEMTVLENVMMSMTEQSCAPIVAGLLQTNGEKRSFTSCKDEGLKLLHFVGLSDKASNSAGALPYGHQRRLEIARALAAKPKILLLDEPAAGMNPTESSELMELILKIRDSGVTVVLIEHHMKVVMGVSDRIVVLDYGNKIAEGTPPEIQANPKVISAYLGKEVQ